ncbi:MAG: hypothetical protein AB1700_05535, partial [Bacillota bacterium]
MDTRKRIDQTAKKILRKHRVTGPPVPVEKIAREEGLVLRFQSFEDEQWSGMLYRVGRIRIIAVNESHPDT